MNFFTQYVWWADEFNCILVWVFLKEISMSNCRGMC